MKRIFLSLLLIAMPVAPVGLTGMTCANNNKTAYQTIGAAETAVLASNISFLDSVVTGLTPTNSVPSVEAAFNDTQLALRTAAALASGGTNAPIPAVTNVKVMNFTNLVNTTLTKAH